jgi:hypothetical protein
MLMLYLVDGSFDMVEQIRRLVCWSRRMIERTDKRRAADMNNSNPQHLIHRIKIWNRIPFAGGDRATSIYRNATALASRPITTKDQVLKNLDNTVGVLLLQVCFTDDGDVNAISDQFDAQLLDRMWFRQ